jgi:hypothetical protein
VASPLSRHEAPPVPHVESGASSFGECGNCGAPLSGPFCSQCGEKKVSAKDYSILHFVEEAVGAFTHFDSRFLRTLKLLFTKPGELSNAYFRGGRSRYTKPLTLFIIINLVFFVFQPHSGLFGNKYPQYMHNPAHAAAVHDQLRRTGESETNYMARFDANLYNQKKSLLIVAVPVLALFMFILFAGSGRTYAEHFVFSVQVYAFLLSYLAAAALVFLLLMVVLRAIGPDTGTIVRTLQTELAIDTILLVGIAVYMYLGFRRAYEVSRIRAAVSGVVLAFTAGFLIALYNNLLFYATFWTT